MKKSTKIIIVSIVAAVLLLGIGYAAISNITLNIGGTLEADPNQANFDVGFDLDTTPTVSNASKVTASITDKLNAKIDVKDLTTVGETVTAEYTVENASEDLSADLAVATTNSNEEYFTIKAELGKTSLVAKETTTVLVTATLTKAPITESVTATVDVELTAMPVQPGEEGTSSGINGSSQSPESTLALVTNANIGDYINLGNNVVGTESTSDDWRILYKDGDTVYAILADYLPSAQVPASAGLDTNTTDYPYSVWSDTGRDTLVNGLKNTTAWSTFTNGIAGATATGSPTAELLMSSYNTKNGTELVYTEYPILDSTTEDYNLYVPHTEAVSECDGYWLASPDADGSDYVCYVYYDGGVGDDDGYDITDIGARPVVSLPSSITAELVDGVWTISK